MSFPDVGRLVTPEEVTAFVAPMNNTIGVLETVVIESVEDMVEDYCQRRFELQEYEDEPYLVRRPSVTFDEVTVVPRLEVRLRNRPVTEFTALKQVVQRSENDGTPVNPSTIGREFYQVDMKAGILIFSSPVMAYDTNRFPLALTSGFLASPYIELLATYEAGYEEIPSRLKLAVLMAIYRVYMMTIQQNWHRTETQTTGAQSIWQSFIREKGGFTPEERMILDKFVTPSAA